MRRRLRRRSVPIDVRSDRGASAVEYGLMVVLIAATVILAVVFLGRSSSETFRCTAEAIRTSAGSC